MFSVWCFHHVWINRGWAVHFSSFFFFLLFLLLLNGAAAGGKNCFHSAHEKYGFVKMNYTFMLSLTHSLLTLGKIEQNKWKIVLNFFYCSKFNKNIWLIFKNIILLLCFYSHAPRTLLHCWTIPTNTVSSSKQPPTTNWDLGIKFGELEHATHRPQKVIWHGAKMDSIDTNCENWHSSAPEKVGLGSSLLGNKLLDQGKFSRSLLNENLCVQHN